MRGHFAKAKVEPKRSSSSSAYPGRVLEAGAELSADHFVARPVRRRRRHDDRQGLRRAMKRWNFGGLRASHGVSVSHRSHGSTGHRQDPGRVPRQEDGRPHGRRARHHAEPEGRRPTPTRA
jgi:large subunit ribosomal protein L3